jgi:hypothetical protein
MKTLLRCDLADGEVARNTVGRRVPQNLKRPTLTRRLNGRVPWCRLCAAVCRSANVSCRLIQYM